MPSMGRPPPPPVPAACRLLSPCDESISPHSLPRLPGQLRGRAEPSRAAQPPFFPSFPPSSLPFPARWGRTAAGGASPRGAPRCRLLLVVLLLLLLFLFFFFIPPRRPGAPRVRGQRRRAAAAGRCPSRAWMCEYPAGEAPPWGGGVRGFYVCSPSLWLKVEVVGAGVCLFRRFPRPRRCVWAPKRGLGCVVGTGVSSGVAVGF